MRKCEKGGMDRVERSGGGGRRMERLEEYKKIRLIYRYFKLFVIYYYMTE